MSATSEGPEGDESGSSKKKRRERSKASSSSSSTSSSGSSKSRFNSDHLDHDNWKSKTFVAERQSLQYSEGRDSFNGNCSDSECPYPIGDSHRFSWMLGYYDARTHREHGI